MSRPNDKGIGDCGAAPQVQTQNQESHFANDDGISKALADRQSLLVRLSHNAAAPSLRAVGEMLREIGGRP